MALIYTGGGYGGSLPGIPARSLADEELSLYGGEAALLATGLWVKSEAEREKPRKSEAKPARGAIDLSNGNGVDDAEATLAGKALAARKTKGLAEKEA